jgi:phenylacetate-CoA ligase
VVVTPLGVKGFPLVRFRTGDVARLHTKPCACGWNTPRLGPVEGRLAQRLKYRGTTLYPESIFQVLQEFSPALAAYVEVRAAQDQSDEVRVVVGVEESDSCDKEKIAEFLQARLRVIPEIDLQTRSEVLQTMQNTGGSKMKKFFDLRQGAGS